MPIQELSAEEIVRLCREYTLFDWSVQSRVKPIPVDRSGRSGVKRNDLDGSYPRSHPAHPCFPGKLSGMSRKKLDFKVGFFSQ